MFELQSGRVSSSPAGVLLRILSDAFEETLSFQLRAISNLQPVFFAHIFINLDDVRIKGIETILLAPGNTKLLASLKVYKI